MCNKLLALIWVAVVGSACSDSALMDQPDTVIINPPADANPAECLTGDQRTEPCIVDIRGRVVDFVTQMRFGEDGSITPIPLTIRYNTAFDGPKPFPVNCPPLGQFPAPAQTGEFNSANESCDTTQLPPTIVLFVDDAGLTNRVVPAAYTVPLTCPTMDCGGFNVTIPVPQVSYATLWREELAKQGMTDAMSRGLAIVQFLEANGAPAQGVTPTVTVDGAERALTVGTELRYLATDRTTMLATSQLTTSPSGVAIVGIDGDAVEIGGTRGAEVWPKATVLFASGWYFVAETRLP